MMHKATHSERGREVVMEGTTDCDRKLKSANYCRDAWKMYSRNSDCSHTVLIFGIFTPQHSAGKTKYFFPSPGRDIVPGADITFNE